MKLKAKLDTNSLEQLKRELLAYKNSLQGKCEILVDRLLQSGLNIANLRVAESPLGTTIVITTNHEPLQNGCKGVLLAMGKTFTSDYGEFNALLAVEFGAGIHYNKIPNPKADKLGYGVGTYPGQVHAWQDEGWFYYGNDGEWHHTYGVKATMPMVSAEEEMITQYLNIAREVFR